MGLQLNSCNALTIEVCFDEGRNNFNLVRIEALAEIIFFQRVPSRLMVCFRLISIGTYLGVALTIYIYIYIYIYTLETNDMYKYNNIHSQNPDIINPLQGNTSDCVEANMFVSYEVEWACQISNTH